MENYENQERLNYTQPMENDEISNPGQDDSEYAPEENEFADGKGTQLAEEFDVPEPEEIEDEQADELDPDLEVDDNKDLNQELN